MFAGKIILVGRRTALVLVCLVLSAVLFGAVSLPAAVTAGATARQLPIYSVERPEKLCALSFDAAWGADATQAILDTLARYNVKTTFFLVGDWVDEYPDMVKTIHQAGHEVMNHSAHHGHYGAMSPGEVTADVESCNDKIEALTGARPTLIRCPYGEYDDHVIGAIRSLGMEPIQWSVDSLDWKGIGPGEMAERVCSRVEPGSIVLFHNAGEHTPAALPEILTNLIREGYTLVPVSQLIYTQNYTIDHAGRQFAATEQAGS